MSKESAFEVGRLYLQLKKIADVLTASQQDIFIGLPGLVGYWPMGMRAAGSVIEHSGSGFNLAQTGVCPTGYDGNSFSHLGNGTNYVSNSSTQLNLTGLETWISSSIRGLTLGGWFMLDSFPGSQGGLISKFGAVTQYAYAIYATSAQDIVMTISGNGSALLAATSQTVSLGQWYFVCGRFTPSTEVAIFVDGDKTVNVTAIPASVFASSQQFEVGRYFNDNTRVQHCKARDVFVCASALSDAVIEEIRATSVP